MTIVVAFFLGVVSGLRAMTPLAIVSWFAYLGALAMNGKPLSFMGAKYAAFVFTTLAIGELINDKLPKTPSRKTPPAFLARLVSGGLVGATAGSSHDALLLGLICGVAGAVAGTLGGAAMRARLAGSFGRDLPAALVEDALGIAIALLALTRFA